MFHLLNATTAPQAAQAPDGVTNIFLLLAAGAFVLVVLRLILTGDLGSLLTTVGGVITAVVVVTVIALVLFAVLLAFHALLVF